MKTTIKRILGIALIILPFACLFALMAAGYGTIAAVTTFLSVYVIVAVMALGVWLAFD